MGLHKSHWKILCWYVTCTIYCLGQMDSLYLEQEVWSLYSFGIFLYEPYVLESTMVLGSLIVIMRV